MNFDTRDPKAMLKIDHGCIEGLPCVPPAADLYDAAASSSDGGSNNIEPHIIPDDGGTTIDVGSSIGFILVIILLSTISLCMCCMNCKLRRDMKSLSADENNQRGGDANPTDEHFDYQGGVLESENDDNGDEFVNNDGNDAHTDLHVEDNVESEQDAADNDTTCILDTDDKIQESGAESEPLIQNSDNEIV